MSGTIVLMKCRIHSMPLIALLAAGALLATRPSWPAASAKARAIVSTKAAEFAFGQVGGLAPGGLFKVYVYSDGSVALKRQGSGNVRLTNPGLKVSRQARRGLLTLAKAEGFASLPSRMSPPSDILDRPSYVITIRSATLNTSVKLIRASNQAFAELYSVLMYA